MPDDDTRFARVYRTHYKSVCAYFFRRLPSDLVDDAVAETFLVAWRKFEEMPEGGEALAWLYGIGHRVLLHQWRGSRRSRRLGRRLEGLGLNAPQLPEEIVLVGEESRLVRQAASSLKETDREILRLTLWEDLSHAEVAAILGLSVEAVRQRYSRAMAKLTREFNRLDTTRSRYPAAQEGGVR